MGRRRPEWAVAGNGQPGRRAPVIARSAASCGRPPLRVRPRADQPLRL